MSPGTRTAANTGLSPDFQDFAGLLASHGVDVLLVGGYAMGAYGVVRATEAIDFFYRATAANVARLCDALSAFGAPPSVIDPQALCTPDTVVMFGAPPQRIDLLSSLSGVSFDEASIGGPLLVLAGVPLRVIARDALIRNKRATGRPKDLADADALERLREQMTIQEAIARGDMAVDDGRVVSGEEAKRRLDRWLT